MKAFAACAGVLGSVLLASCGDQDQHQLGIAYPLTGYSILYADQTADSICFLTFDSWRVSVFEKDWMRVEDGKDNGTIKHDDNKLYYISVPLEFAPNTTHHSRIGEVDVRSYEYIVGARYLQYGHLNISNPLPKDESLMNGTTVPDSVSFTLNCAADAVSDTLVFSVRGGWELTFVDAKPEWIDLEKEYGARGRNRVELTFTKNTESEERSATVRLTSGRVTNDIKIVQEGKKEEEEE